MCSKLEEAKNDNMSIESLISLEEQFKSALSLTRARKVFVLLRSDSDQLLLILCLLFIPRTVFGHFLALDHVSSLT